MDRPHDYHDYDIILGTVVDHNPGDGNAIILGTVTSMDERAHTLASVQHCQAGQLQESHRARESPIANPISVDWQ